MLPYNLQGLATRWLACLPGRDPLPLDYATLPGRTVGLTPFLYFLAVARKLVEFMLAVDRRETDFELLKKEAV